MKVSLCFLLPALLALTGSCLMTGGCSPQTPENSRHPESALLEQAYKTFREDSISGRRFKHEDILPLIDKHRKRGVLNVKELGTSVEGRNIYQLIYGKGETKIMLWSQMHGDESTATMALFDLFNFLEGRGDEFDTLRTLLAENATLYFIPMLNPDGAEDFKRRNSYGFDINRDAVRAASPEASILKQARAEVKPGFGFNLHDQSIYYNVSGTAKPATISVLSPAFNQAKDMNEVRERAMKVIVGMNRLLQEYIPGGVAKYDDTFEPRAFGDNFQKWGTSTILIESGGYKDDPEKQFIRKLNFLAILNALTEIASGNYRHYDEEKYFEIPDNENKLNDLLIRNLTVEKEGREYLTDVSIRRGENSSSVSDLGDLSVLYGYQELDASGLTWQEGKLYEKAFPSEEDISREEALSLLRKGYLAVGVNSAPAGGEGGYSPDAKEGRKGSKELPLLLTRKGQYIPAGLQIGEKANFFLCRNGRPVYAVVKGRLIKL